MIVRRLLITSLCLVASVHSAFACAGPRDVAALKIASLQQRLMVAGLACHADQAYNSFVLGHRAELQRSDADLKAYFIRNGGEAGYDAYKTRLANLAAHGPATDQAAFCAGTEESFSALARSGDVKLLAVDEKLITGEACEITIQASARPPVQVAMADEDVTAPARALPAMPYAETPPPAPAPQLVAASRDMYADAPPRPSSRYDEARYWYYRSLYARP